MQKIIPHLWFDTQAKEATAFYATLFADSKIEKVITLKNTPSGDCDMVTFKLAGLDFMAISAGPYFKLNPSVSLFVTFDTEAEIETVWNKLMDGGTVLMPYDTYPWAAKYGWLQDKYGLSWQLSLNEGSKTEQKITPFLMFTKDMAGKAKEAMELYASIFPNSKIEAVVPYEKGDGDKEGLVKHARFTLGGQQFMALESSLQHAFSFNEAFSLVISCETQEEIDFYWNKLSAVPEAEQCGWLKDKYGLSWQVTPAAMNEMFEKGTEEQIDRVTQAFLKMKKFDIALLRQAYEGDKE